MPDLPESTRSLVVTRPGGRDVLAVETRPVAASGPGQALVKVAAVGVNFIDVYQREGIYPMQTPYVPCMEAAGEVVALGDGVTDVTVGDRVAWAMDVGTASEYAAADATRLVPVPDGVGDDVAAAALLQGMTAHFLSHSAFPVTAGTTAVLHAAAGGVGQLLVQMLRSLGARVIATAGSPQKCATATALGADAVIDTSVTDDLASAIRAATGEPGADVVYDGVGRATFDASLAALRPRGLMCLYGAASGPVPPFDIQRLNQGGSLYLTRPSLAHYMASRDELLGRADAVYSAIADGRLHVTIGGAYPFDDAASAYEALEGRRTQGKLILHP